MSNITCLRCKESIDPNVEQCPSCGEKVTLFQRTYSSKLLDGKYQILDRLGIGGMGEIFKVRHIHLNELRVIKIMRPNVAADDQGLQRFLQEARTSTMIKHKNLAMLYDFSTLEDGSYYMVWEFIDGTNIQKWIAQNGPMPPRLTVEISVQALSGLEHLHSMGLIHRDISPENIMLSQDHHGKLLVKVIDFGIAKQLAEGEGGQGLTQTGMFLGKLKYASPEQAGFLKENEHLDPRSDLYSYGIVMYEMLAGRAPFQATNPHGYILKHVTEKPAPISELNPAVKVPPQLESIIFKSLEKNRDARYATAGEFEHALEAVRNTIHPDQKYGLGERMITLSGAATLADLQKMPTGAFTAGGPGGTQRGTSVAPKTGPTGTRAASDEATVMEKNLGPQTMSGQQPTQAEHRGTMSGSNEATVVERLGGASTAPTAIEQKWSGGSQAAEATVVERKYDGGAAAAPAKSKTPMIAAIAAVLVIAIAVGAWFMTRKATTPVVPGPQPTASTEITSTATTSQGGVIPANQGVLLLSASPWGDLDKIVRKDDNKNVDLSEEKRSTPTRIELAPGQYVVSVTGPKGTQTVDVKIDAGKPTAKNLELDTVNYDDLEKEVNKQ
ncbi:MAG: eukaryotic-like serine/threonine-protein kinase [Acidobacteriota bacterium]|jgi:serine/threonine protein kinase|nr:eukaryotic-like serine/threonine-protein kinase [Acidobacteriota bacterium]